MMLRRACLAAVGAARHVTQPATSIRTMCSSAEFGGSKAERPASLTWFDGGKKATLDSIPGDEYVTPSSVGVTLAPFCTRDMGDGFGMYRGRIAPGGRIGLEIHPGTTETIYVLNGTGTGFIGDSEFDMNAGDVMHVEKNTFHGLINKGDSTMDVIVVGNPDY